MDKRERDTLANVYAEPVSTDIRWEEIEHVFLGLGANAKWSDHHHLEVRRNGHKHSFETPRTKSDTLTSGDVLEVRQFLGTAGITEADSRG